MIIGQIVVYIIVICAVASSICAIIKPEREFGKMFVEGITSIGPIFLSVAGIFAALPYFTLAINYILGPLFQAVGADPGMAATSIIAVDMGGYQLAELLSQTKEDWIMAMMNGYMAGATIVFSIPVGLRMIEKKDHKYFTLGILSGVLTIPIGVLVSSFIMLFTKPMIRETIATNGTATYSLVLGYMQIFKNLIPLVIFCLLIALGLFLIPRIMIKGFNILGTIMDAAMKLFLAFFIVEHFTGFFTNVFGIWPFDPVIADEFEQNRALEIAGFTSLMLAGAFPMMYLIKKYLSGPLTRISSVFHISSDAIIGSLTAAANVLALYPMIKNMEPEDKIKSVAFAVCGAFLIGDHLSFTANFQPTLILPLFCGKLVAGGLAIFVAGKIAVPKAKKLEQNVNIAKQR